MLCSNEACLFNKTYFCLTKEWSLGVYLNTAHDFTGDHSTGNMGAERWAVIALAGVLTATRVAGMTVCLDRGSTVLVTCVANMGTSVKNIYWSLNQTTISYVDALDGSVEGVYAVNAFERGDMKMSQLRLSQPFKNGTYRCGFTSSTGLVAEHYLDIDTSKLDLPPCEPSPSELWWCLCLLVSIALSICGPLTYRLDLKWVTERDTRPGGEDSLAA